MRQAQALRGGELHSDLRFIMLGAFGALVVALLTTFGPHRVSAFSVERRLGAAVSGELARRGFIGVRVTMHGQTAILDGVVSTPEEAAEAGAVALTAAGQGGWWRGGVVKVVNHVASAGARLKTPALSATGEGGALRAEKVKSFAGEVGEFLADAGLGRRPKAEPRAMMRMRSEYRASAAADAAERGGASCFI